ncbi:EF-hand domain-containing protein [Hyphococcus luteus]|uniref:Calcium-binding protein n=1 Tax=Hyphococcus luteus TaxID=2058213 RepID=A0A2S7K440_9PROT|nr:EF-hand domain-containing protein [Marinicaulis flavus]PQA87265.1 calcium-binding protein [Marinicaulis flavus]
MKTKLMLGTMAAAGAALMAAGAMAAEGGKGPGQGYGRGFDRMDVNGDGKLTAEEMSKKHAAFIEQADADGDGAVTKEEMKAFHEARRAEWREKRNPDENGDGVVDRTEYMNAAQERFDRMDKDGDGVLSEDEMRRRHHRGHGRRFRGGDKD